MANGKKPKKGIQLGPDVKKAINIAAEALVGPTYETAKGVYNYLNPSKPIGNLNSVARRAKEIFTEGVGGKSASPSNVKKSSPPKTEKIYDLGVLPEHEVVANKGVKRPHRAFKEIKKSTGSQGAENMKKAPIIPAKSPLENRSDLKRNSAAMMKVKNPLQSSIHNGEGEDPVTPLPGKTQNISDAKEISQKKFERKLKKGKEGEVFETPNMFGNLGIGSLRPANVKQTYVKKGKNTFIKREGPKGVNYLKTKNKS
tara:strand:+ start:40 stop:807 length:768 start_codon:yes stop_codon:yes gene_type:complete